MKKTQFFKKKLENFLKNSMHRNSSGSVKKPSGAQKKKPDVVPVALRSAATCCLICPVYSIAC